MRGAPTAALSFAAEHAKRFPRGQLASERTLIQIEALHRLNRDSEARSLGRGLLAGPGAGLYSERVHQLLLGENLDPVTDLREGSRDRARRMDGGSKMRRRWYGLSLLLPLLLGCAGRTSSRGKRRRRPSSSSRRCLRGCQSTCTRLRACPPCRANATPPEDVCADCVAVDENCETQCQASFAAYTNAGESCGVVGLRVKSLHRRSHPARTWEAITIRARSAPPSARRAPIQMTATTAQAAMSATALGLPRAARPAPGATLARTRVVFGLVRYGGWRAGERGLASDVRRRPRQLHGRPRIQLDLCARLAGAAGVLVFGGCARDGGVRAGEGLSRSGGGERGLWVVAAQLKMWNRRLLNCPRRDD